MYTLYVERGYDIKKCFKYVSKASRKFLPAWNITSPTFFLFLAKSRLTQLLLEHHIVLPTQLRLHSPVTPRPATRHPATAWPRPRHTAVLHPIVRISKDRPLPHALQRSRFLIRERRNAARPHNPTPNALANPLPARARAAHLQATTADNTRRNSGDYHRDDRRDRVLHLSSARLRRAVEDPESDAAAPRRRIRFAGGTKE